MEAEVDEGLVAGFLDAVCERIVADGELSDDGVRQLNIFFEKTWASAAELLDHATITRITPKCTTDTRVFWKVHSTSGSTYHCFAGYCSCHAFANCITHSQGQHLICKHLLAVRLAEAMGKHASQELDDDVWGVEMLRGCGE